MTYDLLKPLVADSMALSYLQEALHASESKLRIFVEHSVDGFILLDADGRIMMWSAAQERITGLPATKVLGKLVWDVHHALTPLHRQTEANYDRMRRLFLNALQPNNGADLSTSAEIEIQRFGGERRIVQQFCFSIPTAEGLRVGCVCRDMTEIRQTTQNLLRRNTELILLNRINRVLTSSSNVQQIQKRVLEEVVQVLDVTGASLWMASKAGDGLVCTQSLDRTGRPFPDAALAPWVLFTERVFKHRQTLLSSNEVNCEEAPTSNNSGEFLQVRSLMGVPIQFKDAVLGVLLLVDEAPKRFQQTDLDILELIAASAAITFENARLYRAGQELAALQERSRLANSLHDAINQSLFSAGLIAEVLPRLIERDPVQASQSVQDLRKLLREAVADLREVLAEMQPQRLDNARFDELLCRLADKYAERTGASVALNIDRETNFDADVQEGLYRLCREAFTNIAKHAEATQVWVELVHSHDGVELVIRDNGHGFDMRPTVAGHFGLIMMQQQAATIGATLSIASRIGHGAEVRVYTPEPG